MTVKRVGIMTDQAESQPFDQTLAWAGVLGPIIFVSADRGSESRPPQYSRRRHRPRVYISPRFPARLRSRHSHSLLRRPGTSWSRRLGQAGPLFVLDRYRSNWVGRSLVCCAQPAIPFRGGGYWRGDRKGAGHRGSDGMSLPAGGSANMPHPLRIDAPTVPPPVSEMSRNDRGDRLPRVVQDRLEESFGPLAPTGLLALLYGLYHFGYVIR